MRMLHNPAISILLFGLLMGLSVACSRRPSDDAIAKDIQNKVATDPATKDSQVNVVAKDGKVTLTGAVSDPTAREKVEQIAHEEPGVAGVEDQTTVGGEAAAATAPPPPGEAAAHRSASGNGFRRSDNTGIEFENKSSRSTIQCDLGATRDCWRKNCHTRGIQSQWNGSNSQSQGQG